MSGERAMTDEIANEIYDILVRACGANESSRESFVLHQTNANGHPTEWRFGGSLGFGGKFWRNAGSWYVNCYSEDRSEERRQSIDHANRLIEAVLDRLGDD